MFGDPGWQPGRFVVTVYPRLVLAPELISALHHIATLSFGWFFSVSDQPECTTALAQHNQSAGAGAA